MSDTFQVGTLKLLPFASFCPKTPEPTCRLLLAAGISYGRPSAPQPAGRVAFWAIRHRFLWSRTEEPDGSLRDLFKWSALDVEMEIGPKLFRLRLTPRQGPVFERADATV